MIGNDIEELEAYLNAQKLELRVTEITRDFFVGRAKTTVEGRIFGDGIVRGEFSLTYQGTGVPRAAPDENPCSNVLPGRRQLPVLP